MPALRLLLGDQLSPTISSLKDISHDDVILMAEVKQEATYVKHHKKKIAFLFSAMRHFSEQLKQQGYQVHYVRYDDPDNRGSLKAEVQRYLESNQFDQLIITEPGEYRLLNDMRSWEADLACSVTLLIDDRFIATHEEFEDWAEGRKQLTMEYWYRLMRKKTGLLMEANQPVGGKWNYDKDNRKPFSGDVSISGPMQFTPDAITQEVLKLVEETFPGHMGELEPFWFAVTASQAKRAFTHFVKTSLPHYGDYQDAMKAGEPFLFHSLISQYINCGLLDPREMCEQVEAAYYRGEAPLNAVEGFIRQIIGWREYIRGVYWSYMPDYVEKNALNAKRELPDFYWTGDTDMRCMSEVINTTKQHACSHHIQRLMVTGNFANLAGLDVQQVCEWYLAVYADAYEWVELPNTLGMALYGDGGIVGTKPYISSGAYINRMSDFCKGCRYDVKQRVGDDACPFTNLYWDYLIRHESYFKYNQRMAMAYRNLNRFEQSERDAIQDQARKFLAKL